MWSGQTYAPTRCGGNRCLATTDTTPIRDNSCLVAVGTPSSLFPNPRPGYTTLGAHNSPALGLLASTNRKDTAPNSNRATTKPLNKRTLVFWHIVSHTETLAQQQQWIDWAIWMCVPAHFLCCRRTQWLFISSPSFSSGFTEQTLKVLTVIHNFDLKR